MNWRKCWLFVNNSSSDSSKDKLLKRHLLLFICWCYIWDIYLACTDVVSVTVLNSTQLYHLKLSSMKKLSELCIIYFLHDVNWSEFCHISLKCKTNKQQREWLFKGLVIIGNYIIYRWSTTWNNAINKENKYHLLVLKYCFNLYITFLQCLQVNSNSSSYLQQRPWQTQAVWRVG